MRVIDPKANSNLLYMSKMAFEQMQRIPTIDAVPVVHGRWIEQESPCMDTYYDCSACGESFCFIEGGPEDNLYSYCPNCGADMREG